MMIKNITLSFLVMFSFCTIDLFGADNSKESNNATVNCENVYTVPNTLIKESFSLVRELCSTVKEVSKAVVVSAGKIVFILIPCATVLACVFKEKLQEEWENGCSGENSFVDPNDCP